MLLWLVSWAVVACSMTATAPPCTCAEGPGLGRWCDAHERGYLASIEIPSARLYEALDAHGHDVDPGSLHCEVCRRAIETDDFCVEHRIGFRNGQAYFSRLTHVLSGGRVTKVADVACPVCRASSEEPRWCTAHESGLLGNVAIDDREGFEDAVESIRILREAIRAVERCERCAVAILTDTTCPHCRIRYRDGEAVDAPANAP